MVKNPIVRVRKNKTNGQKYITVPYDCDIEEDDYVQLKKIEE